MMSLKNSLTVLWIYILGLLYVLGLWLFLSGFLLKRIVIHQNATQTDFLSYNIDCYDMTSLRSIARNIHRHHDDTLFKSSLIRRFQKAIILIIDALRYDFVAKDETVYAEEKFYKNQMPIFQYILKTMPTQSALFKLQADPPTTTLQRLKGLTTGSLPTFIDVSLNFASPSVEEDNIIRQMVAQNKSIIFMGDDTWDSIFPNHFQRIYSFPSFNVKDLDTVDDGILEHLFEEIFRNDTDIVIAHFLGVDHCGHRYGPRHPEMTRKLKQMNNIIQNVIQKMKKETVLFVLGDHGMTESGDHGGDSIQEVSTALFVYSSSGLMSSAMQSEEMAAVHQVDLVPTISILLGLPIPFSNIGTVIKPLISLKDACFDAETDLKLAHTLALAENALQVQKFIKTTTELPGSFITSSDRALVETFLLWNRITDNATETRMLLHSIMVQYQTYLEDFRTICTEMWTTFSFGFIVFGLVVLAIAVFCNLLKATPEEISHDILCCVGFLLMFPILSASVDFYRSDLNYVSAMALVLFISQYIAIELLHFNYKYIAISHFILSLYFLFKWLDLFPVLILELTAIVSLVCVKFSRPFLSTISFASALFNIPSVIAMILFFTSFSNSFVVYEDRITLCVLQMSILFRFIPLCIDIAQFYFPSNAPKTKPTKKPQKRGSKVNHMLNLLCIVCLMLCVRLSSTFYKCREEQMDCENSSWIVALEKLHGEQFYKALRLGASLLSVILPTAVFLSFFCYWFPARNQPVSTVCVRYGLFFVAVLTCLRWWLDVVPANVVERTLKGNEVWLPRVATMSALLLCILVSVFPTLSWEVSGQEMLWGSTTSLAMVVLQILWLVCGDALAPPLALMAMTAILFSFLIRISEPYPWLDAMIWSLLCRHFFYSTAHQSTFSTIRWESAFLLHPKVVRSHLEAATLVVTDTFASPIFYGIAFPLLLTNSWSAGSLHMKYVFCHGLKVFGTVLASTFLRRHLMVWKIFAPKLIYEVLGFGITMIFSFLGRRFADLVSGRHQRMTRTNVGPVFNR